MQYNILFIRICCFLSLEDVVIKQERKHCFFCCTKLKVLWLLLDKIYVEYCSFNFFNLTSVSPPFLMWTKTLLFRGSDKQPFLQWFEYVLVWGFFKSYFWALYIGRNIIAFHVLVSVNLLMYLLCKLDYFGFWHLGSRPFGWFKNLTNAMIFISSCQHISYLDLRRKMFKRFNFSVILNLWYT